MLSTELPALVSVAVSDFFGLLTSFKPPKSKVPGIIFTAPAISVMVAVAVLLGSAIDAPVNVTAAGVGSAFGAE